MKTKIGLNMPLGDLLKRDKRYARTIAGSELFDASWYLDRYPDVRRNGLDPALHYFRYGWKEGRDPGPRFSTAAYLLEHDDVARAGVNPLLHFLKFGKAEGRQLAAVHPPVENVAIALTLRSAPAPSVRLRPTSHRSITKRRVAIFASYSAEGRIHPYVEHYLAHLSQVAEHIIFVADNPYPPDELAKIQGYVAHAICERHGEYDFGSYKRGIAFAVEADLLENSDELILCNDSCYGPIGGFGSLFDRMSSKSCDFWGVTASTAFGYHLQSYFVVFKNNVFRHTSFSSFFEQVEKKTDVSQVVLTYEVPMTQYFRDNGFKSGCLIDHETEGTKAAIHENPNLTVRPRLLLDLGCPLLKVKAFKKTSCNLDGIDDLLADLKRHAPTVYSHILEHASPVAFFKAPTVRFSVILPFHNRIGTLPAAIDSALTQRHQNFELILVDDGSDDGSAEMVQSRYRRELETDKIVLLQLQKRQGVSAARNAGLEAARGRWIAYLDSDNKIRPNFLSLFASSITEHPKHKLFYAMFMSHPHGTVRGRNFLRKDLLKANFVDLGVFVHSRDLFEMYGGFDTWLKRLVDWDLIIRYTTENTPVYIPAVLMDYHDSHDDTSRISVKESLDEARIRLRRKHGLPFYVTTIIPAYNHEKYIKQAINSAINQKGNFIHEIIICDDGSADRTPAILSEYAKKHGIIRNLSTLENNGISSTFRRCINAASGDFIAILEGDDYWTDEHKLEKQLQFLKDNEDSSMVFSQISVLNAGKSRNLKRQADLAPKLTGRDFLSHPTMNLIANFSSCLFRAGLLRSAPDRLFQGRFNEIAIAFHLEQYGKIGFINRTMGVYRQHPSGVWSGSDMKTQLESAIAIREMVRDVADPIYTKDIQAIIDGKRSELTLATSRPVQ